MFFDLDFSSENFIIFGCTAYHLPPLAGELFVFISSFQNSKLAKSTSYFICVDTQT